MTGEWPERDLVAERLRATPDRLALVDADDGETWTYRDLEGWTADYAERLEDHLDGRHARVGTLLPTRPEVVPTFHAVTRRAATLVPLNVRLAVPELVERAARADLDVLVCAADTAADARAVAAAEGVDVALLSVDEPTGDGVEPMAAPYSAATGPTRLDPTYEPLLLFTSGTTGEPKGVRLRFTNLVAGATASAFRLGVAPDDRWLCVLPTYHMGGLAPVVRSAVYGTAAVVQREFDPAATAAAIRDHDVTGVSLVPTMLTRLLDHGWEPPDGLRFVLLGGAPASRDLIERCEERGVPVHPTYGMTETASQVATARPAEAFAHPGTVGQPLYGTEVTVVDPEADREALRGASADPAARRPRGERGELVVDGPTVSPGYLDGDRDAFSRFGFHTGDLGYRDEDGRLWVVGRVDDTVITGGEKVRPPEVVDALRAHPAVEDAAVVGLADEEWGQRVAALVVPADPEAGVAVDDLDAHCRERLAGYKVPRTWGFVAALPRTASGTVDRAAVRERLRDASED